MKAYNPYELPLDKNIINPLLFMNGLIDANKKLAFYESALKYSKINPELFMKPLIRQEATLSSKIEGSRVTLDEALEYDTEDLVDNNDTQEILNYHKALIKGERLLQELPLSTRLLKELHKTLLDNDARGSHRAPGEFRKIQNFIGPLGAAIETATFVPPEPQFVDKLMSNLEKYMNYDMDELDELVKIAIIHIQFETIHPFLDGNGRIGRILIPLYLYDKKVINKPHFFMSETLERDKFKYYDLLNKVRFNDNWNEWIKFFLNSISIQSEINIRRIEKINELYDDHINIVSDMINSSSGISILNVIYQSPIFTINSISEISGIDYQTCNRIIKTFENNKIVYSNGVKRNTKYYYYDLLNLIR